MLSRLNILSNHVTSQAPPENLLEKYRKMSTIDQALMDEIYYLGQKAITEMFELPLKNDPVFV